MPPAYVLINCDQGSEWEIIKEIKGIDGVEQVEVIYGAYDIIVTVGAINMEKLKNTILWKIRKIPQVRSTLALIVTEGSDTKS